MSQVFKAIKNALNNLTWKNATLPEQLKRQVFCMGCKKCSPRQGAMMDICDDCSKEEIKRCFVCKKSDPLLMGDPTCDCSHFYHRSCVAPWETWQPQLGCPQHFCHTCHAKGYKRENKNLMKCVECPAAYHGDYICLPAGCQTLTKSQIICPRHLSQGSQLHPLNIDICFTCREGGSLVCCSYCCNAFHPECVDFTEIDEYKCQFCKDGHMPLYFTIVWAKVGRLDWLPALLLPEEMLLNVKPVSNARGKIYVFFLGKYALFRTTSNCVVPFSDFDINPRLSNEEPDEDFKTAFAEAAAFDKQLKMIRDEFLASLENTIEVSDMKEKIRLGMMTTPQNKFGVKTYAPIAGGNFIGYFTGGLINHKEMKQRILDLTIANIGTRFKFVSLAPNLVVTLDADSKPSVLNSLNHSCDPNCMAKTMTINGSPRMGIFAKTNITTVRFNFVFFKLKLIVQLLSHRIWS